MSIPRVEFKLPGARKTRSFVVYPTKADETRFMIQASDAIMVIDKTTGEAVFNVHAGGAYGVHLDPRANPKRGTFPDLLAAIKKAMAPAEGKVQSMGGVVQVQY